MEQKPDVQILTVGEGNYAPGWQGLWNENNVLIASFKYEQGTLFIKPHLTVNEVFIKV